MNSNDAQELVRPAVGGTKGILRSVQDQGETIKRVIVASAFASIMDPVRRSAQLGVYRERLEPGCVL